MTDSRDSSPPSGREGSAVAARLRSAAAHVSDDALRALLLEAADEVRPRAEDAARGALDAQHIVRRLVRDAVAASGGGRRAAEALGRRLAAEAPEGPLESYLQAYAQLGLGELVMTSLGPGSYAFSGTLLFDAEDAPRAAGCELPLAFLSAAVSRAHGGQETLAVEIACERRGRDRCRFIVQVKEREVQLEGAADAPGAWDALARRLAGQVRIGDAWD